MKDIENTKKEAPIKEAPFLGLTGMGGGVNSLMWAGAGTQKFDLYSFGIQGNQFPVTHPSQQFGTLGLNQSYGYKNSPVQVPGDWYKIYTGGVCGAYGMTVAGSKDEVDTLWMWGSNAYGNLAQNQGPPNTANKRSSPTQVPGTDWANVSTSRFTLAVKTDGTLWAWGCNQYGELGTGNKTTYSSPKQVGTDTNWSSDFSHLSCSAPNAGQNSFAIKTDGTMWAWGQNTGGGLGLNNNQEYSSPKQIGTNTNWKSLALGSGTVGYGIKTDGTLWGWGWNNAGSLGQNDRTQRSSPVQIPGTNWKHVTTGGRSWGTFGIKTDGTLWSWGYNTDGVLGQGYEPGAQGGTWRARSSPVQVGTRTDWGMIDSGPGDGGIVKGITTDGVLWVWGNNLAEYALGVGPAINARYISSPTQVANINTKWGTDSAYDTDYAWSLGGAGWGNVALRQQ